MAERHSFRACQVDRDGAQSHSSQGSLVSHWLKTASSPASDSVTPPAPPMVPAALIADASTSSSGSFTTITDSDSASRFSQASTLVNDGPALVYVGPDVNVGLAVAVTLRDRNIDSSLAASLTRPLPPLPGDVPTPTEPSRPALPPVSGGEMLPDRRDRRADREMVRATGDYRERESRSEAQERRVRREEGRARKWEMTRCRFSWLMDVIRGEARERRENQRKAERQEAERRETERRTRDLWLEDEVARLEELETMRIRERQERVREDVEQLRRGG